MKKRQVRAKSTNLITRNAADQPTIEGYFAVFNSDYEIAPGMSESIAPGAFSNTLTGDIRALVNHDSTLVLGRTAAHTLSLHEDNTGLYGKIYINKNDNDAMNLYERVKRGDVSGCSFGFEIVKEESNVKAAGSVHWTIKEVKLYEVSCCTFPAYSDTNITARTKEKEHELNLRAAKRKDLNSWRRELKSRHKFLRRQ